MKLPKFMNVILSGLLDIMIKKIIKATESDQGNGK